MKIAVAGTGYVGLSLATLLAQHNEVKAVDIIPEKVELINKKKSPIQDETGDYKGLASVFQRSNTIFQRWVGHEDLAQTCSQTARDTKRRHFTG